MGKGKGRGSAKATFRYDIQQHACEAIREHHSQHSSFVHQPRSDQDHKPRPRVGLGQLRNLLRERRSHEHFEWRQQRRRNGFLPPTPSSTNVTPLAAPIALRPLGSLLFPNSSNSNYNTLQSKCLQVLGDYLPDYKEAMGKEALHQALALLDSDALAKLSVIVSKSPQGVDDEMAVLLGGHPHVQSLCFRGCRGHSDHEASISFSDRALLDLIPPTSSKKSSLAAYEDKPLEELASWEDFEDGDLLDEIDSSSYRLKRLELVECPSLTSAAVQQFLEASPFLTHLSLAGCFLNEAEGGQDLLQRLPDLLPGLQVLDLTKCSWVTNKAMIRRLQQHYFDRQQPPPRVYWDNLSLQLHQGVGNNDHRPLHLATTTSNDDDDHGSGWQPRSSALAQDW